MTDRRMAISAVVELYHDRVLTADQARLILRGLGASDAKIQSLRHDTN